MLQDEGGLIPRVLHEVYRLKREASSFSVKHSMRLCISFIEIYNDHVSDLLAQSDLSETTASQNEGPRGGSITARPTTHSVKENHTRGVYVENMSELEA